MDPKTRMIEIVEDWFHDTASQPWPEADFDRLVDRIEGAGLLEKRLYGYTIETELWDKVKQELVYWQQNAPTQEDRFRIDVIIDQLRTAPHAQASEGYDVETVAKALLFDNYYGKADEWDMVSEETREDCRRRARVMIEYMGKKTPPQPEKYS